MGKVVIVYKGLTGEAKWSPEDNQYQGSIVNIPQEVTFSGATISDLQLSFTQAVDAFRGESRRGATGGATGGASRGASREASSLDVAAETA